MRVRLIVSLLLPLAILVAPGCGGDSDMGPDIAGPGVLTVRPSTGSPGTRFLLTADGLEELAVAELSLLVGGEPTVLQQAPDGSLHGAVPLFPAANGPGHAPPPGPVDVELRRGGETLLVAKRAMTVLRLPDAAGSTRQVAEGFLRVCGAMESILGSFDEDAGVEQQIAEAVFEALEDLIHGEQGLMTEISRMEADAAAVTAMVDGVFAANDLVDFTNQYAEALESIAAELASLKKSEIDDIGLAKRMQAYVVIRLFGQQVIGATAQTFGLTVGTVLGVLGAASPALLVPKVIAAFVAVLDFVVNKFVVGLMPAQIESFTLDPGPSPLGPGESTSSVLVLKAVNDPPPVGIQEFIALTIGLLGLRNTAPADLDELILSATEIFTTTFQSTFAAFANAYPELNLEIQLDVFPDLEWSATLHDPRLVDLQTFTPSLITPLTAELNWRAADDSFGDARISARTAVGPQTALLSLPPGFSYNAGAFGEDVASTATKTVKVQGEMVVEVNFASTIEPGGANALEVRVGYRGSSSVIWQSGISVSLSAVGGTLEDSGGQTDVDGQFITIAWLAPGSHRIDIDITVSDGDETVQREVFAIAISNQKIELLERDSMAEAAARATVTNCSGGRSEDKDEDTQSTELDDFGAVQFTVQASANQSVSCTDGNGDFRSGSASGSGSAHQNSSFLTDPDSGDIVGFKVNAGTSGQGTASGNLQGAGRFHGTSYFLVRFNVLEPLRFRIQTSIGPGSHMNLRGGRIDTTYIDVYSDDESASVVASELLGEGEYRFFFCAIFGSGGAGQGTSSDFTLEFVDPSQPEATSSP